LRGEDLSRCSVTVDQTRSFCYVDDLVEGIYRLLLSDYAGPVNVGNPKRDHHQVSSHEEIIKLTGTTAEGHLQAACRSDDPDAAPTGHHLGEASC
jgi:dTDP-glucose 4,6-dehydratase